MRVTLNVLEISICIYLSFIQESESKKKGKGVLVREEEEEPPMALRPEGKKMPEVIDPYALANDPTAMDLFTEGFELPENKPNREIKKFLRKQDHIAFRREMRVRFMGKSRHPNTENNWRTKRTEPEFTSVETHPNHAIYEQKYTHLFIE